QIKTECESAQIGCVDCKLRLGGMINDFFAPVRERREKLAKDPDKLREIIEFGNKKARKVARQTLADVQEIMGMERWEEFSGDCPGEPVTFLREVTDSAT